jgi:hypothetical protein
MSDACLYICWNRPHVGMSDKAFQFLGSEAQAFLKGTQGKYSTGLEIVALTAHAGTTNGFLLLHGERAKLDELRRTDEFEAFSMKMGELFDGYGVVPGLTMAGIEKVMARRPRQ